MIEYMLTDGIIRNVSIVIMKHFFYCFRSLEIGDVCYFRIKQNIQCITQKNEFIVLFQMQRFFYVRTEL